MDLVAPKGSTHVHTPVEERGKERTVHQLINQRIYLSALLPGFQIQKEKILKEPRPSKKSDENRQCNGTVLNYSSARARTHTPGYTLGNWVVVHQFRPPFPVLGQTSQGHHHWNFLWRSCQGLRYLKQFKCDENSQFLISQPSFNLIELKSPAMDHLLLCLHDWSMQCMRPSLKSLVGQLQLQQHGFISSQDKYDAVIKQRLHWYEVDHLCCLTQ
jgi:hypothetical protein